MKIARETHAPCSQCGQRSTDLRGVIAILGIVLVFGLAYIQLLTANDRRPEEHAEGTETAAPGQSTATTIAPWAAGFLLVVVNNYYSSKSAERMVATLTRPGEPASPTG